MNQFKVLTKQPDQKEQEKMKTPSRAATASSNAAPKTKVRARWIALQRYPESHNAQRHVACVHHACYKMQHPNRRAWAWKDEHYQTTECCSTTWHCTQHHNAASHVYIFYCRIRSFLFGPPATNQILSFPLPLNNLHFVFY